MIKPPKKLILAFVILYAYAFFWWFMEAMNPNLPKTIIAGAPAPTWYCWIGALYVVNLAVAFMVASD